ncbi:MAG TPA: PilZ domain-containing protein [Planctomycetota bacterium]|nr:PilZ domain-containing protein [Planctomycetota bacterium]
MNGGADRREYPRIKHAVPVRYKFMSASLPDEDFERVCDGMTQNLSLGGLQLVGVIPNMDWTKHLLTGRVTVGINLYLPGTTVPVKFQTRCFWIEAPDDGSINMRLGLRIHEIATDQRRILSEFLTRATTTR